MRYRVHIYPVVRVTMDVEADTPEAAIAWAFENFDGYRAFPEPADHPYEMGRWCASFGEEFAGDQTYPGRGALLDPLGDSDNLDEDNPEYGWWIQAESAGPWEMEASHRGQKT